VNGAEARSLFILGGDLAGQMTSRVEELHRAVANRAFDGVRRGVGPAVTPVRAAHDGVAAALYGGVRAAARAGAGAIGGLAAIATRPDSPSLTRSSRGALASAALNGLLGDGLEQEGSALAIHMSCRVDDRHAEPTPKLAIFVHGLCETGGSWRLYGEVTDGDDYGSRLRRDLGYTPVYLTYNTGLHISENGRLLSDLLEELIGEWPGGVEETLLVGHSMGGLVCRSACHQGLATDAEWIDSVRHTVCLGAPHIGAPLEKGVNAAGWALNLVPETRPIARLLETRSVGIKDLRFGSLIEDDWRDCASDALLDDRCTDVPLIEGATHYVISASIGGSERSLLGHALGDLLVRRDSALGRSRRRRIAFEEDCGNHFPGLNHFQLLNHPLVYEQMKTWLDQAPTAQ
jgi:pimeloyl-ACP methyl ester carboxylesterase